MTFLENNAMHEENFLSSWLREGRKDREGRTVEMDKETDEETSKKRGREKRRKERMRR